MSMMQLKCGASRQQAKQRYWHSRSGDLQQLGKPCSTCQKTFKAAGDTGNVLQAGSRTNAFSETM